jgi:hypothetical protein
MMLHFQSAAAIHLEYRLQSLHVLPIELPRLVPSKMQVLELDASRNLELYLFLRLESYLFLLSLGLPHLEKMHVKGTRKEVEWIDVSWEPVALALLLNMVCRRFSLGSQR